VQLTAQVAVEVLERAADLVVDLADDRLPVGLHASDDWTLDLRLDVEVLVLVRRLGLLLMVGELQLLADGASANAAGAADLERDRGAETDRIGVLRDLVEELQQLDLFLDLALEVGADVHVEQHVLDCRDVGRGRDRRDNRCHCG
jgi:hypothetical protein